MEEKSSGKFSIELDLFGLKSAGEASKQVTQLGIDGVKTFLNLTCRPLLEEIGLGLTDKYRTWRLTNIIQVIEKAQGKLKYDLGKEKIVIDPRVAFQIAEHASLVSNETLQDMWAGLFAASCCSYEEDENIFFIDLLKRLTSSQVKFLNHLCKISVKDISINDLPTHIENGIVRAVMNKIEYTQIIEVMETSSTLKADSELNALYSMGLLEFTGSTQQDLSFSQKLKSPLYTGVRPSLIALLLYIKCQGSTLTPFEYFLDEIKERYYKLLKAYLPVDKDMILNTVYEKAQKGKKFDLEIEFGSNAIVLKNQEWADLTIEELNEKLRLYIIFRQLQGIEKFYEVTFNGKLIGNFEYLSGVTRTEI